MAGGLLVSFYFPGGPREAALSPGWRCTSTVSTRVVWPAQLLCRTLPCMASLSVLYWLPRCQLWACWLTSRTCMQDRPPSRCFAQQAARIWWF